MEVELAKATWFTGNEFTAADIQTNFPVEVSAAEIDLNVNHKNLSAYLDRIHSRPAYQRASECGGEYQVLNRS